MSSSVCSICGQTHEGIPLSFAADFPDDFANLSHQERAARAVISSGIRIQPAGIRPLFFLDEPHSLTTQQQNGISLTEAQALASHLLYVC